MWTSVPDLETMRVHCVYFMIADLQKHRSITHNARPTVAKKQFLLTLILEWKDFYFCCLLFESKVLYKFHLQVDASGRMALY